MNNVDLSYETLSSESIRADKAEAIANFRADVIVQLQAEIAALNATANPGVFTNSTALADALRNAVRSTSHGR